MAAGVAVQEALLAVDGAGVGAVGGAVDGSAGDTWLRWFPVTLWWLWWWPSSLWSSSWSPAPPPGYRSAGAAPDFEAHLSPVCVRLACQRDSEFPGWRRDRRPNPSCRMRIRRGRTF